MENNNDFEQNLRGEQPQSIFNNYQGNGNQALPNATASLVLGILSIVGCYIGWILGIIGLVLANKDKKLYEQNPGAYSLSSYNNSKAGKICSIIGICIWGLFIILYICAIIFAFSFIGSNSSRFR
jgi:uncharacterized membrane protein